MLDCRAEQPLRETNLELHPHKLMVFRDRHTHIMTKGCDNYVETISPAPRQLPKP